MLTTTVRGTGSSAPAILLQGQPSLFFVLCEPLLVLGENSCDGECVSVAEGGGRGREALVYSICPFRVVRPPSMADFQLRS